jgi:hypothetical protein
MPSGHILAGHLRWTCRLGNEDELLTRALVTSWTLATQFWADDRFVIP